MPVFRTPIDALHGSQSFYDTLVEHLRGLAAAAKLSLHRLNDEGAHERFSGDTARTDLLLVFEGKALAAVEFRVFGSRHENTLDGYIDARAYQGTAGSADEGNLDSMAERLQAQLREGMPPVAVKAPEEPQLRELVWHINLRAPGQPANAWTGGPFDLDKIEAAFEVIVKTILGRAKG